MKQYKVTVNGTAYEITLEAIDASEVKSAPAQTASAPVSAPAPAANADGEKVNAPMPGNILDVKVSVGAKVSKGDVLLILEAMKMENEIMSPCDGTVASISVKKGDAVETGSVLCVIA